MNEDTDPVRLGSSLGQNQSSEEASAKTATAARTFVVETLLDKTLELDPEELLDDEDLVALPIGLATYEIRFMAAAAWNTLPLPWS